MRRILCALCALAMLALPCGAAAGTAGGADELLNLVASVESVEPFSGAPGARTAWAILLGAVQAQPALLQDDFIPEADLRALYDALFAEGALPEPDGDCPFAPCEGGYTVSPAPTGLVYEARALGAAEEADRTIYDVAVLASGGGGQWFVHNLRVALALDEKTPFGGHLLGLEFASERPQFESAEATARLGDPYRPENALDGDPATCWSYNEGRDPRSSITLVADGAQAVRGLMLMPQNAKDDEAFRANNRVRTLRVTLSDGYTVTEELDESTARDAWDAFTLDRAHQVDWIEIQVIDVYEGGTYDDTCISEIVVF